MLREVADIKKEKEALKAELAASARQLAEEKARVERFVRKNARRLDDERTKGEVAELSCC